MVFHCCMTHSVLILGSSNECSLECTCPAPLGGRMLLNSSLLATNMLETGAWLEFFFLWERVEFVQTGRSETFMSVLLTGDCSVL